MSTAVFVLNIIAAPVPCSILAASSMNTDMEKTAAMQQTVNIMMPAARTVFLPVTSAILPDGTENAATASVYPVISQPAMPALISN